MGIWIFIMAATLAASIAGGIYLTIAIGRFGWIRDLSKGRRLYRNLISLAIVIVCFAIACKVTSVINAIIMLLHVLAFFLLFGIIFRMIRRFGGRRFKIYWQGWLALLSAGLTLGIGYYLCVNVWKTEYDLTTDKEIQPLRIAFFSDSHIGATFDGEGFVKELKKIEDEKPDILLIPGDFVDDWSVKEDLIIACEALGEARIPYGVWFSYGNHDPGRFADRDFSDEELQRIMSENNIHILDDSYELIDGSFYVVGRRDYSQKPRKDIDELLSDLDHDKYIIVLDHQPNDYENEGASAADLVLSGHTHGGQLFPFNQAGVLFDQYDRAYGYEQRDGTDFIVSSGIADWELLFKTGTKSEFVIIDLE